MYLQLERLNEPEAENPGSIALLYPKKSSALKLVAMT
jgi:hypothetical protein